MQQIFLSTMPDNLHVALLLSHCLVFHHYCRHRLSKKIARKSKASKQALKPSDPASLRPIAIGSVWYRFMANIIVSQVSDGDNKATGAIAIGLSDAGSLGLSACSDALDFLAIFFDNL